MLLDGHTLDTLMKNLFQFAYLNLGTQSPIVHFSMASSFVFATVNLLW